MTNENDKKILFSLISTLDIFNKENLKSAQNALYGISFNVWDDKKITEVFNGQVRTNFNKSKLKSCLLSLSKLHKNGDKIDIDQLVSRKMKLIKVDGYVTEKVAHNVKSKNLKKSSNKVKHESSPIKTNADNTMTNKTDTSKENNKKASKKRKASDDVGSAKKKIIKVTELSREEPEEKVKKPQAEEEIVPPNTKKELDDCLKEYKDRKREKCDVLADEYKHELDQFNRSVERVEAVSKRVKNNIERIQNYVDKYKSRRSIQEKLHASVLNELCEFYWKHVHEPATGDDYDIKLSGLSTKLAEILKMPEFCN